MKIGQIHSDQKKVLVCGDRHWHRVDQIYKELDAIHKKTPIGVIIEGDAKGADKMAGLWAHDRDIFLVVVKADWKRYGRAAGPIRNQEMLDLEPDLVVAFHSNITNSKGTKNMLHIAKKAGVDFRLFT